MADRSKRDDAQAQFSKIQKAEDGKKAMSEYEAAAAAIRAKTERLRALRLARDAALEGSPASGQVGKAGGARASVGKAAGAKKQPGRKKAGASATLSDWLSAQEQSGRRS